MTGTELVTQFETLVEDDTTSSTQVLIWLNAAYDMINLKRPWNYTKKTDTTKTVAAATAAYALPSDFQYPLGRVWLRDSNLNYTPLNMVSFEDRFNHVTDPLAVYIDVINSQLTFVTTPAAGSSLVGQTIVLPYAYAPTQIAGGTSPVFVRGAHMLLAYEAAKLFWYNDQSEKDRAWNREMQSEFNRLYEVLETWDARMDAGATGNAWNPASAYDLPS